MYYTYMLRCQDNSIYTGMTADLERRMQEHFSGENNCAKYTNRHKPKKLEMAWECETRALALKLEFHIKKDLTKLEKEDLIKNPKTLDTIFGEKIDYKLYKKVENLPKT